MCFGKVNITSQIQAMTATFSALVSGSGIELYFIQGGFLTVLPKILSMEFQHLKF